MRLHSGRAPGEAAGRRGGWRFGALVGLALAAGCGARARRRQPASGPSGSSRPHHPGGHGPECGGGQGPRRIHHEAGRRDPRVPRRPRARHREGPVPDLVLRNGMGLERWFEKSHAQPARREERGSQRRHHPHRHRGGPVLGKPNPHSWMSPKNALQYVENIRRALVEIDPANAATYNANAAAYADRIRAVDEPLRARQALGPSGRPPVAGDERGRSRISSATTT